MLENTILSSRIDLPNMHPLYAVVLSGLLSAVRVHGSDNQDTEHQGCSSLAADEIRSMGNNSLFTRWRPQSHVNAPAGWLNDPCAPMYDPFRDEYHIMYQWHPNHIAWGNISWGHAKSKDLVTWTDVGGWRDDEAVSLSPTGNGSYNGLGIFSGTGQPVNLRGEADGTLLLFYTSVKYLPIFWKSPYAPYSETQSLAYSKDGGDTWHQHEGNPVINVTANTAPVYWNVTGLRDPFFEPWPAIDNLIGQSEPHYYMVMGSGIRGVGPRIPLFSAPASDLTDWKFLGALWEPSANSSFGPMSVTGNNGFNFEVSGFFSLADSKGELHYYTTMGSEGGNISIHPRPGWALWSEGTVTRRENGSVQFNQIAAGASDWGLGYAVTQFDDTKHNRRIQWAWAPEDIVGDETLFSINQQGFQGALTIPRELFVHETYDVINPHGDLTNGDVVLTQSVGQAGYTYHASTLGRRPAQDVVEGLRVGSEYRCHNKTSTFTSPVILESQSAHSFELLATFSASSGPIGLTVAASPEGDESTYIFYNPSNNTIIVDRTHSSNLKEFNNSTVTGYFDPYTLAKTGKNEDITFHIFVDGSLLEVFVNERFALSTRIYPSKRCSTGYGVFVGDGAHAEISSFEAWVGLKNVWPERPLNSSSALVFDTPEQTNNYTWWSGI